MKKTSLALIVAMTAFSSMAANAVEGQAAGTGTAASTCGMYEAPLAEGAGTPCWAGAWAVLAACPSCIEGYEWSWAF